MASIKPLIIPKSIKEINQYTQKETKVTYMVNVRECGLDYMFHRNLISEDQHKAGIKFRTFFEKASGGGNNYDLSRIRRGKNERNSTFTISDGQASALQNLGYARDCLGESGYSIAIYICGQDYSLIQTRKILNINKKYMGERLREILSDLSRLYGFYKKNI